MYIIFYSKLRRIKLQQKLNGIDLHIGIEGVVKKAISDLLGVERWIYVYVRKRKRGRHIRSTKIIITIQMDVHCLLPTKE